jgi:antitoxin (DNA-binding transcriptional repressor) of toxin-antitoxin stability system
LSELADQVKAGAEKIITKNGESYVALIDAERLDYYHRLERERIHLLLIDDARRGLADIAAGRTKRPMPAWRACRLPVPPSQDQANQSPSNVAEPLYRVELTASFLERLASIETFLDRGRCCLCLRRPAGQACVARWFPT